MADYLKMAEVSAILTLKQHGWSQRKIARELGIHPDIVGKLAVSRSLLVSLPAHRSNLKVIGTKSVMSSRHT